MFVRVGKEVQEMLRENSVSAHEPLPWYVNGLRFQCTRCGACCSGAPGYVWVDTREIILIADYLGLTTEQFGRKHLRQVGAGRSLLELSNGDCEFLERLADGTTRCRIHEVRPTQCRTWPFWRSNLSSPRAWELTARHCPGIDRGAHRPLPAIQAALQANGRRPL